MRVGTAVRVTVRVAVRVVVTGLAGALLAVGLSGCDDSPPMLQPVAPVPTVTEG
ncbi:hypothetical protein [Miniimonas arenae]|uniref:hypothetical protein n=1 Tax=Miniimonas arenae TaxID=676201 RepID=UPI0028AF78E4|nr:hypothetical protein [Miniimonas arenae]